jgi:hypothetical protein
MPRATRNRVAAGFGHDARRGCKSLRRRSLIAAEGHVDDDRGMGGRSNDGTAMGDHHVDRHRKGGRQTVNHHAQ